MGWGNGMRRNGFKTDDDCFLFAGFPDGLYLGAATLLRLSPSLPHGDFVDGRLRCKEAILALLAFLTFSQSLELAASLCH